jgi:hypothetical protein
MDIAGCWQRGVLGVALWLFLAVGWEYNRPSAVFSRPLFVSVYDSQLKERILIARALFVLLISTFSLAAQGTEVSKAVWMKAMSTALPEAACKSDQYFRQCFDVTAKECEDTLASATRVCLDKYKDQIPDPLVQPRDGGRWGAAVGGCAGEAYEHTLMKKRVNSEKCNNPKYWQ